MFSPRTSYLIVLYGGAGLLGLSAVLLPVWWSFVLIAYCILAYVLLHGPWRRKPEQETEEELERSWSEDLMQTLTDVGPLFDFLDGYRAECLRHGYSETAAEMMVMDAHHRIVTGH